MNVDSLWQACEQGRLHLAAAANLMEAAAHRGSTDERIASAMEAQAQCAIAMGYLLVSQAEHWALTEGVIGGADTATPAAPAV
jgi:hypothetical protein